VQWAYPKPESVPQTCTYVLGDTSPGTALEWSLASAHMLGLTLSTLYRLSTLSSLANIPCQMTSCSALCTISVHATPAHSRRPT
jgi:hypothetical protein